MAGRGQWTLESHFRDGVTHGWVSETWSSVSFATLRHFTGAGTRRDQMFLFVSFSGRLSLILQTAVNNF